MILPGETEAGSPKEQTAREPVEARAELTQHIAVQLLIETLASAV
jgi:hypothetical protein